MPIVEYNKLVRNRIPFIIEQAGKVAMTRPLKKGEFVEALCEKLTEEANEYLAEPTDEELADILEVVMALIDVQGSTYEKVETLRLRKKAARGSFSDGVFLLSVQEPD